MDFFSLLKLQSSVIRTDENTTYITKSLSSTSKSIDIHVILLFMIKFIPIRHTFLLAKDLTSLLHNPYNDKSLLHNPYID